MSNVDQKIKLVKAEYGDNKGKTFKVPDYKGNLSIMSTDMPAIKKWATGEEYQLIVTVKQTGSREADEWEIKEGRMKLGDIQSQFGILSIKEAPSKAE